MGISYELERHIKAARERKDEKGAFALQGVLDKVQQLKRAGRIKELPREERVVIKIRVPNYAMVKTNNGKRENILEVQMRADQLGVDVSTLIPRMPTGTVIKAWREVKDLRASDVSRGAGISDNYLSMAEQRQNEIKKPERLASIANVLGIPVEDIKNGLLPDGVTIRFIPLRPLTKSQA